jgi:hypothetical protein
MLQLNLAYKINPDNADITPSVFLNEGLLVWLKADAGTTTAGGETWKWADQSGNGNDFEVPAGMGFGPLLTTVSGVPRIRFQPGNYLQSPSIQAFPDKRGTILIAARIPSLSGSDSTFMSTNNGTGNKWDIGFKFGSGELKFYSFVEAKYYPVFNVCNSSGYYGNDVIKLFCLIRNEDAAAEIYLNGKPADSSAANPDYILGRPKNAWPVPGTQPDANPITLGNDLVLGSNEVVDIYELLMFDRVITDIERQQLEIYLSKKWNINLFTLS